MSHPRQDPTPDAVAAPPKLHIFVNRRKFGPEHGVTPLMTGAEIAALIGLAPENAVVRREHGGQQEEVPLTTPITIDQADHFVVTRRTVEGGHAARSHRA
jgi:hypothetical protein